MRYAKLLLLALPLTLLLGCSSEDVSSEELALQMRGGYLASPVISATCDLTADYGERVYDFTFEVVATAEKTALTLTAPAELQGMVVEIEGKTSTVQCDGVLVETGALSEDGLTPVTAVPAVLDAVQKGYIQSISSADGVMTLTCGEENMGTGQQIVLTLDETTGDLLRGEIFVDGARKIDCEVTSISWSGLAA